MSFSDRPRRLSVAGMAFLLLAGCASYEPKPLDLGAYRAESSDRLIDSSSLRAFMDRLQAADASAAAAFDASDGLTCAEAETFALFHNASLRAMRLEAGVAAATAAHAGLWEDPVFGFDGAEVLSASAPFEYGLTLGVTIPISGRLEAEKARAGAASEAMLRRVVESEWALRFDVRRAWCAWSAAVMRASLAHDVASRVERIAGLTDRLESAGELSRVEARLMRVDLADRRARVIDLEGEADAARIELMLLLGLTPDSEVDLAAGFASGEAEEVADPAAALIERNLSLASARAAYREAEAALRVEVRKQYPDITIGGGYGNEEREDRLLLGVSLPVPMWNRNQGGVATAEARREAARGAAEATFDRVAAAHATASVRLASAQRQLARFESEIVPLLESQSSEVEEIASLGEVDTFLLLEAVTRLHDAKLRLLELRLSERMSALTVEELLGPEIDGEGS